MDNTQADDFRRTITVVYQLYNKKPPDRDLLRTWWDRLYGFELEAIQAAFNEWIDSQEHLPTVAAIVSSSRSHSRKYIEQATEKSESKPSNPESVRRFVNEIKQFFANAPKRNNKNWARRILKNHNEGVYVLPIALKFAQEAMGATK